VPTRRPDKYTEVTEDTNTYPNTRALFPVM
jgi:hypothetical protein